MVFNGDDADETTAIGMPVLQGLNWQRKQANDVATAVIESTAPAAAEKVAEWQKNLMRTTATPPDINARTLTPSSAKKLKL
ncbi:hypothetical protein SARC_05592 [Sphaeroforma arctica JP610]|uniref:Uncharacterized protein n=1 Tax=Sphaeroforma arctica JP610 TaxID=667725 RepID=A0A0L0G1R4_9EUKA|nr:hypothetical protein SARC_05592 [Sphaeroforma arctica JP610]KNC82123.1 hypothetical protein SARC_05592 [Sphaeroforma arctica JP610]|eukprot:XP_014156025.1 hypothetical protein SARC_05592 [Sphaeroforma arctica JP610]